MVTWIWLGGLIVFAGGLIAIWPRRAPRAGRRRRALRRRLGARARPGLRHERPRWTSLAVVLIALALAAAVAFVGAPLRRRRGAGAEAGRGGAGDSLADLEAAQGGEVPRDPRGASWTSAPASSSEADYEAIDRQLRAEAVEILRATLSEGGARTGSRPSLHLRRMLETILSVVQVAISRRPDLPVLMHSGKDAGLSGAFGVGTGAGPLGGGSLVERNLNRWTVGFALAVRR